MQSVGSRGAAGAGAQICPAPHAFVPASSVGAHARAARDHDQPGRCVVARGAQAPPVACAVADSPYTFAQVPCTSAHAPSVSVVAPHGVVHA